MILEKEDGGIIVICLEARFSLDSAKTTLTLGEICDKRMHALEQITGCFGKDHIPEYMLVLVSVRNLERQVVNRSLPDGVVLFTKESYMALVGPTLATRIELYSSL